MERNLTPKTTVEIFQEAFPMYLAIGMTYEQFWEQESWLVKSYREANKIRSNDNNFSAWLHGLYFLQALQAGIPVTLVGMAKGHIDLPTFPEKPLDFSKSQKEQEEKKQMEKQVAKMKEMAERFNKVFKKKQENAQKQE